MTDKYQVLKRPRNITANHLLGTKCMVSSIKSQYKFYHTFCVIVGGAGEILYTVFFISISKLKLSFIAYDDIKMLYWRTG